MVALPKLSGKAGVVRACACGGCGFTTKSTWHTGHDGHCEGWAVRVLRGLLTIDDVPAEVRAGVILRLKRHDVEVTPKAKRERKAKVTEVPTEQVA